MQLLLLLLLLLLLCYCCCCYYCCRCATATAATATAAAAAGEHNHFDWNSDAPLSRQICKCPRDKHGTGEGPLHLGFEKKLPSTRAAKHPLRQADKHALEAPFGFAVGVGAALNASPCSSSLARH